MTNETILNFLRAVDAELDRIVTDGRRLDFYLIGRSALILRYGLNLATKDVDMVGHMADRELEEKVLELFGKGSSNATKLGLYLEEVPRGMPPLPAGYGKRSSDIPGEDRKS